MTKMNQKQKCEIISGSAWAPFAIGYIVLQTTVGAFTNVLNIINSSKHAPIKTELQKDSGFKLIANVNENMKISYY